MTLPQSMTIFDAKAERYGAVIRGVVSCSAILAGREFVDFDPCRCGFSGRTKTNARSAESERDCCGSCEDTMADLLTSCKWGGQSYR